MQEVNPVRNTQANTQVKHETAVAQPAKAASNDSKIESMAAGSKPAEKSCLAKTWEVISKFFQNLVVYIKERLGFNTSKPAESPAKKQA